MAFGKFPPVIVRKIKELLVCMAIGEFHFTIIYQFYIEGGTIDVNNQQCLWNKPSSRQVR